MTINNRPLNSVVEDITLDTTPEATFKTGLIDIATQVNASQIQLDTVRTVGLTGEVTGTGTFTLNELTDANTNIRFATTVTDGVIDTANLMDLAVQTAKIDNDAVTLGVKTNGAFVRTINEGSNGGLSITQVTDSEGIRTYTIQIADGEVDNDMIANGTITNDKLAGSISNANLANNQVTLTGFGGGRDVTVALGGTGTIPTFDGDSDGLLPARTGSRANNTNAAATLAVMTDVGDWYRIEPWAVSDSLTIPASRVATVGQSRMASVVDSETYADSATGAISFVRLAANRDYPLGRNDSIQVTYPDSGNVYALTYTGNGVTALQNASADEFVSLGSVDSYLAGNGLTLTGNTFSVSSGGIATGNFASTAATPRSNVQGDQTNAAQHVVFTAGTGTETQLRLDGGSDFTYNPNTGELIVPRIDTVTIEDSNASTGSAGNVLGQDAGGIIWTTVGTSGIADDAVTRAKMADDAVGTDVIAEGAVTFAKIQNIATNRVLGRTAAGSGDVSAIQVDADMIADDAVTSAKIADDAVVQAAIADNAVNEARLQISNTGSNGQVLTKRSGNTGGMTWETASGGGAPGTNAVGTVVYARYQPNTNVFFSGYFTFSPVSAGNPSLHPIMHRSSGTIFFAGARIVGGTWRSGGSTGSLVNENVDITYTRIS